LQAPELLGQQPVSLQGTLHEHLDLENQAFQNFQQEIVFLNGSDYANLDIASTDDFGLDKVLWMELCLTLGNPLPINGAIAKLSAIQQIDYQKNYISLMCYH